MSEDNCNSREALKIRESTKTLSQCIRMSTRDFKNNFKPTKDVSSTQKNSEYVRRNYYV